MEPPLQKSAGIKINKDFLSVTTYSGYRMFFADDMQKSEYLSLDVLSQELGRHIWEALSLSRRIHPVEEEELYFYMYNTDRYKEWLEFLMKKFGYKIKSKVFKPMLTCYVTLSDGLITIMPSNQRTMDGWDRTGLTEADNVIIPESCTDEELGAAARLAISRCTSKYV